MTQIYIPQVGMIFTLLEDWEILVPWFDRNLRMLSAFKLTGMRETKKTRYVYDYDSRKPLEEEYTERKTVANPIFRDNDGKFQPALISIPEGTIFNLTKYHTSYQGRVNRVGIKCVSSSKKGIKNLCMELPLSEFNKLNASFVMPPEKDD
jgi:hypothetical protein